MLLKSRIEICEDMNIQANISEIIFHYVQIWILS